MLPVKVQPETVSWYSLSIAPPASVPVLLENVLSVTVAKPTFQMAPPPPGEAVLPANVLSATVN